MDEGARPLRYGLGQRLEFIEFRLFWEGQINRADLIHRFGISTAQASADLTKYQSFAPQNVRYDTRLRTYLSSPEFQPVLHDPSARQYLADLRGVADEAMQKDQTWLGIVPDFAITPIPRRRLDARTLRSVVEAIRGRQSIRVLYQSLTQPEAKYRWICPHALAYDGARWHARAWCNARHEFRDFVLARVLHVSDSRPQPIDPENDLEWTRTATLRIGPRPELEEGQRRVIEFDYGMVGGAMEITLKLRMAFYLEQNLLIDQQASGLPAQRAQLQLLNRDEIERLRAATDEEQARINRTLRRFWDESDEHTDRFD